MKTKKRLDGPLLLDRRLASDAIWMECDEPFCRRAALVDLMLLSRTHPGTVILNGEPVQLETGQLAWSLRGLGDRWKWSFLKTQRYLEYLEADGAIAIQKSPRRTIITIRKYAQYHALMIAPALAVNGAPITALTDAPTGSLMIPEREREREGTRARGEKGNGEGEIPTAAEVRTWAEMSMVDPAYAERKRQQCDEDHGWERNGRLIDWRRRWLRYWSDDRAAWVAKHANGDDSTAETLRAERQVLRVQAAGLEGEAMEENKKRRQEIRRLLMACDVGGDE